jgi:ABC-type sulfate/molybdate transport systems ATPase subunit
MAFALHLASRPPAEADHWLRRAQAEHLAQRTARQLSVGEGRRVAIVRALGVRPGLLLLEEPYAGLDEESR